MPARRGQGRGGRFTCEARSTGLVVDAPRLSRTAGSSAGACISFEGWGHIIADGPPCDVGDSDHFPDTTSSFKRHSQIQGLPQNLVNLQRVMTLAGTRLAIGLHANDTGLECSRPCNQALPQH